MKTQTCKKCGTKLCCPHEQVKYLDNMCIPCFLSKAKKVK